jgi:hypothetical protein
MNLVLEIGNQLENSIGRFDGTRHCTVRSCFNILDCWYSSIQGDVRPTGAVGNLAGAWEWWPEKSGFVSPAARVYVFR